MNAKLEPLHRLVIMIGSLNAFVREQASELDVYQGAVYRAIAQLLSAFGGLCMNLDLDEEQEGETPYHDFGPEPETREEAVSQLPGFLDQVGQLLHEDNGIGGVHLATMQVRAGTFAFLLAEGEVAL